MTCPKRVISPVAVSMLVLASFSLVAMNHAANWIDGEPTVTTDKSVYLSGQNVGINVTCYVPSSFSSTGQCFYVVKDALGTTVYDLRLHVVVGWVLTTLVPPKTFSFTWGQKNDAGQQVSPGIYDVWGYEAGYRFFSDLPIAGNSTGITVSTDTIPVPTLVRFDVNLLQGWNLFSLPLLATNYTSASLGLPPRSVVVKWNSTSCQYDDIFVVGVSPPSWAFALAEGVAYWIFPSSYCTVSIYGTILNATHNYNWDVPAQGGWVLVSFPKSGKLWHASEVASLTDKPYAVLALVHWNPGFQRYSQYMPGVITSDFYMIPGSGCWVYLSESVVVSYGP